MVLRNFDAKQYLANYADLQKAFDTDEAKKRREGFLAGEEGATFDAKQYLSNYADLQKAFGTDEEAAKQHYRDFGAKEGRRDTNIYDQAKQHFRNYGIKEGRVDTAAGGTLSPEDTATRLAEYNKTTRDVNPGLGSFDAKQYLKNYVDLQEAFGTDEGKAREHFLTHGIKEGRVDTASGMSSNILSQTDKERRARRFLETKLSNLGPDASPEQTQSLQQQILQASPGDREAKAARMQAAAERRAGFLEGEEGATFDAKQYLANYKDLQEAFGTDEKAAIDHYRTYGVKEGRTDTTDKINVANYLSQYKDLQEAYGDDREKGLQHYYTHGLKEGRSPQGGSLGPDETKASFDAKQYLKNYGDLQAAFGDDTEKARQHYLQYGIKEKRTDREIDPIPYTPPSPTPTPPSPTPTPTPPSPTPTPPSPTPTPPTPDPKPDPTPTPPTPTPTPTPPSPKPDPYRGRDPFRTFDPKGENPYKAPSYEAAKNRMYEMLFDRAEVKREKRQMRKAERKSISAMNKREQNRRNNDGGEINIGDVQGDRGSVGNLGNILGS